MLGSTLARLAVRKQSATLKTSFGALQQVASCRQNTCKNAVFAAKDPNGFFGLREVFIFEPESVIGKSS